MLLSDFVQNAFDVADSNSIDIGDLCNRHAVSRQGADARKLRARDLARHRRLGGGDPSF